MQWAAVTTHLGEMSVPPQNASCWQERVCHVLPHAVSRESQPTHTLNLLSTATCHGQRPLVEGFPPTMRSVHHGLLSADTPHCQFSVGVVKTSGSRSFSSETSARMRNSHFQTVDFICGKFLLAYQEMKSRRSGNVCAAEPTADSYFLPRSRRPLLAQCQRRTNTASYTAWKLQTVDTLTCTC